MNRTRPFPRFMICAPASGSGKTLITCALLSILSRHGYLPASFKCGPDYIDPMFHKKVLKIPARNLDVFLMGNGGIQRALCRGADGRDIGVLEGVMGVYDGIRADSAEGSSYEICAATKTPAILVVNTKGMSRSVIPLVKGFCDYDSHKLIKGILLNNISPMIAAGIKEAIEKETGVPVIGMMPKLSQVHLESRHLGLVMPQEIPGLLSAIEEAADKLEETLDLERLIGIAKEAQELEAAKEDVSRRKTGGIKVGVAMDEAFSFYYEDNLDLLRQMGAEPVPFSPIHDSGLPEVSRLIFGGGYPELHAGALSANVSMRAEIRRAAEAGMPILAECGGFLYLQESLTDPEGQCFEMTGVFKGKGTMRNRLHHFGYVSMSAMTKNPYIIEGEVIRAHEYHYYDTSDNGEVCLLQKPSGATWSGYQCVNNAFGGFAHLYYPSHPMFLKRFLET